MTDSFPRRQARTRRFTLGAPRGITISPDGDRIVFLRSRGGTDPVTCLWTLDAGRAATERLVADPRELLRQRRARRTCPPRSGPAGSAAGSRPAVWSATPPTAR